IIILAGLPLKAAFANHPTEGVGETFIYAGGCFFGHWVDAGDEGIDFHRFGSGADVDGREAPATCNFGLSSQPSTP
ncbi:MAG: hypothetical protein WAS49_10510, partial [Candidatus Dechloromonas phosphoritropha]